MFSILCRSIFSRRQFLALFAILLGWSAAAVSFSGSAPAFWEVRKGDATVYLMGSMHFGRTDFYPLPAFIEDAFISSTRLVVEVNLLDLRNDAPQVIFKHAGLPQGTSLKEVVSTDTYKALEERAKHNQVPFSSFQRFQPWYVTLMLVEGEIRKTSLQQQLGIDLYFLRRARSLQKPIEELETFDSQLGLFSSFTFEDQERFLRQTLGDLQNSQGYLISMADAWMAGDVNTLAKTLIEPFRTRADSQLLFDKMFTRRNLKMAAAVDSYLSTGGTTFFVVGVGHMLGSDGVVELLGRRGLSVRRLPDASPSREKLSAE